jgi:hypothetical protein
MYAPATQKSSDEIGIGKSMTLRIRNALKPASRAKRAHGCVAKSQLQIAQASSAIFVGVIQVS